VRRKRSGAVITKSLCEVSKRLISEKREHRGLSFDRAALALSAAADGLGVELESTRLAETELAIGTLMVLNGTQPPWQRDMHFLCYRNSLSGSRKIERFKAWIEHQLLNTKR
jgi:LysR family glycine cleavage system transcriptional activator